MSQKMLEFVEHYPCGMQVIDYKCESNLDKDMLTYSPKDWMFICCNFSFNERQIDKYKEYIDWNNFSIYQDLSEDIIRQYKDKVNWNYISQFQKLSYEFVHEFLDKINFNFEYIKHNYKLDDKTKELCKTFL